MIYNLISGIEQEIRREFPESAYSIYTENTEQGMEKPCFFILCVKQSSNAKLGRRFMLNTSFDVQYFASLGNKECWEAAEKLRGLLGEITVDGCLVEGNNINIGVDSGVVHFFIDYNLPMMMQEQEAVELMEEVTVYGKASKRN